MKVGDKVITSKGRFGSITNINGTRADVLMGTKTVEILLSELKSYVSTIPLSVWYIDKFDITQTERSEIIFVDNSTILYSNESYTNSILDSVSELLLKRLDNKDLIITKIKFVK